MKNIYTSFSKRLVGFTRQAEKIGIKVKMGSRYGHFTSCLSNLSNKHQNIMKRWNLIKWVEPTHKINVTQSLSHHCHFVHLMDNR